MTSRGQCVFGGRGSVLSYNTCLSLLWFINISSNTYPLLEASWLWRSALSALRGHRVKIMEVFLMHIMWRASLQFEKRLNEFLDMFLKTTDILLVFFEPKWGPNIRYVKTPTHQGYSSWSLVTPLSHLFQILKVTSTFPLPPFTPIPPTPFLFYILWHPQPTELIVGFLFINFQFYPPTWPQQAAASDFEFGSSVHCSPPLGSPLLESWQCWGGGGLVKYEKLSKIKPQ